MPKHRKLTDEHIDFIIKNRYQYTFNGICKELKYCTYTLRRLIQPLIQDGLIKPWLRGGSELGTKHNSNKKAMNPLSAPIILSDEERLERLRKFAEKLNTKENAPTQNK